MGHEDAFPRARLSARCRFSQGDVRGDVGQRARPAEAAIREMANLEARTDAKAAYEGSDTEQSRVYSASASVGGIARNLRPAARRFCAASTLGHLGRVRRVDPKKTAPRLPPHSRRGTRLIVLALGEPFGDHRLRD
jgi:hypothetical protein